MNTTQPNHSVAIVAVSLAILIVAGLLVLPGFRHNKAKAIRINTARNIVIFPVSQWPAR